MNKRKEEETQYYNDRAQKFSSLQEDRQGGSIDFLKQYLKDKCFGKNILDYGCGNGFYSWWLAKCGGNVTAIDLSEKSLEVAKKRAEKEGFALKINFSKMDCEKLEFKDNSFDIIFDGGTFSSLDLSIAYVELARVLKPDGFLIGIETFGHNPLTNFKRKFNKSLNKGTLWSKEHIFNEDRLRMAHNYFKTVEVEYFHIISWICFPLLSFGLGQSMLKILEKLDGYILKALPFLKKYSFKIVFVFKQPIK